METESETLAAGEVVETVSTGTPYDGESLVSFFAAHAVPGVESVAGDTYSRTVRLVHGPATITVQPRARAVRCAVSAGDPRDISEGRSRCRWLLDLGTDPTVVDAHLGADPVLAPLVQRRPGLRIPGHVDAFEVAVRTVVGQQISVAGACTIGARLTATYGEPLTTGGALTHLFPTAEALAVADPAVLPMPRARGRALVALAQAVVDRRVLLDGSVPVDDVRQSLVELPGVGPWTADYVAIRALGERDLFLPTDLAVRRSLARLGVDSAVAELEQRWSPWRSYALMHVWASLADHDSTVAVGR